MENIVSGFFKNSFTQEQQTLLYRGLGIAEVFNIGVPVTSAIQEEVMREQETQKEDIIDAIWDIIIEGVDKIIFAHRITLNEEADLSFKLTILENLFAFSHRETYQPFATILSNWEFSNEEKLCKILAELSGEDESYFQEYVEWVYVGTLNRLQEFVENKVKEEEGAEDVELLKAIRSQLLTFEKAFGKPKAIEGLREVNPVVGAKFQTYLDLFYDEIIDISDLESTTWKLMYLAFISEDGYLNPQKLLQEKSMDLFPDLIIMNKFNAFVLRAMGRFHECKELNK